MKAAVVLGLLLVMLLMIPAASFAIEAQGIRHAIPCFLCSPDAPQSVHVVRSTGATAVVIQVNIYDANGILVGNFVQADPGGTFLTRQIAFTSTDALAGASPAALPAALYSAVLFESTLTTQVLYEQVALGPGGISGILTGRGNLYGYANVTRALTLFPESVASTPTGLTNFFVCNNPANNMATFLGVTGPAPGNQGVAQLINPNGDLVINTFATQSTFAKSLSALSPGATGGSLFVVGPGTTVVSCVKFVRISVPGLVSTVGGYSY